MNSLLQRIQTKVSEASSTVAGYQVTESLFLRLLGLIFLFAFWSLHGQILGLAGSHGIIPADRVLAEMRGDLGARAFRYVPTIFWMAANDAWLSAAGIAGILASIVLLFGGWLGRIWEGLATLVCYVLYLSLISIGQPFTSFQWDALLLESAFLALFAGHPLVPWVFRFLAFRLMFESGCVKLTSGDPNWRNLHALRFHFMTQPLPTPPAWFAYHAPPWLLDSLTFLTLAIELVCPWLLFLPRRIRYAGAGLLIGLQVSIMITGNYAFFNWLTIALCLWAFDDSFFSSLTKFLKRRESSPGRHRFQSTGFIALSILMLIGATQVVSMFARPVGRALSPLTDLIAPFQIVNTYGLFAIMTTTRPEIIFEASDDGQNWLEYSFPYKPGDVKRGLPIVAPFQPRLDWQLWFAALDGDYQQDRWTGNVAVRLLQGEPSVLKLLQRAPFQHPPRYVRALLYDYSFTSEDERKRTGAIWNRRLLRTYLPPVALGSVQEH